MLVSLELAQSRIFVLLHLDLVHEVVKVLLIPDLILMPPQQRQDQLIEENPSVLEELVKKVAHMICWDHTCEESEDPLTRKYLSPDVVLNQSVV